MMRTHPTPFRANDRVGPLYARPNEVHGAFLCYCKGYLSHCVVQWDGEAMPKRIKASKLRLVERPPQDE